MMLMIIDCRMLKYPTFIDTSFGTHFDNRYYIDTIGDLLD